MVILDTSVIIDHLRRRDKPTLLDTVAQKFLKETIAISIVTVQELFEGKGEEHIVTILRGFRVLPYTFEIAKRAGEIARDIKRPIDLADAAIAATAIMNGARLFTLNSKDFRDIEGLELLFL